MNRLPEEIIEYIIGYAVPDKASIVRNGRCFGGHQHLFCVSKQFHRIAATIYYCRPLRIYVTHGRYVCGPMCRPTFQWIDSDDDHCRLPLRRFKVIELYFHPEISFIDLHHDTTEVIQQMTKNDKWDGIYTESSKLSKAMKRLRLPGLVNEGLIQITIKFLEACPFHDPVSYANSEKLPSHHIPLWDVENVWRILEEFRWLLRSIRSLDELPNVATLPNIAWTAPYHRGDFSGADFGPDFLSNLTLVDIWDGSNFDHDVHAAQAWSRMRATWGQEHRYDLETWLARFNDPKYASYNISPRGKMLPLDPYPTPMIVNDYNTRARQIGRLWWYGGEEMIHKERLIESILSKMRQLLDCAVSSKDKFQLLVADARMQVFPPVLAEVLAEIANLQRRSYWRPFFINQARDKIRVQLKNLKRLGLWDGKWKDLNEGDHVVAKSDEELEHFWCRCGKAISLDLEEIVAWGGKQGIDVEELSMRMRETSLVSDLSRQRAHGCL